MFYVSLKESLRNLIRRPLQSSLAILGIVCGIAGVFLLGSIGQGVSKAVNQQIATIGPGIMSVVPTPVSTPGKNQSSLNISDIEAIKKVLATDDLVTPVVQLPVIFSDNSNHVSGYEIGVSANYSNIQALTLVDGQFFTDSDYKNKVPVIVITQDLSNQLFPKKLAVGKNILVSYQLYRVVGVVKLPAAAQSTGPLDLVFTPASVLLSQQGTHQIAGIVLKVDNPKQVQSKKDEILTAIMRNHHFEVTASDFTVHTQDQILAAGNQMTGLINLFVRGAVWITILLGGIGIMNVMLVAARERQHEIGIYLAYGIRPIIIQLQFLLESVWISTTGAILGIVAGTVTGLILQVTAGVPWGMNWILYGEDLLIGISLGLIFGVYPSLRVGHIVPAEVIRK